MKRFSFPVLCLFLATLTIDAEEKLVITKDLVRKAIAHFRADPTSEMGRAAQSVVVKFSHDSPDILIVFKPKNYPIGEFKSASQSEQEALLAAFIVGNVDSQLRPGHARKEDSYADDLQLIRTYRQLQHENPKLKLPAIEKMAELETRGELKAYLSSK